VAATGRPGLTLILPSGVRRAILAHARRTRPHECCGLLIGRGREVFAALPARNMAQSAVRFELDPRLHIDTRRVLRQMAPDVRIIGVYHSHPDGPPRPSATDVAEAAYPEWVHVIVGLATARPAMAAYRIRGGRVAPVGLRSSARG
jgi:proteasome lid subunit RPN8/RPN11